MDLPPKVVVPICIEQGSIYHYRVELTNRDRSTYRGQRFFIVLNVNPKTDEVIVLTTVTTKIEEAERYVQRVKESPETLVRISRADFPRLSAESVVNCNSTYPSTMPQLIKRIEDGGIIFFEKLPRSVIEALVGGVLKSTQVPNEQKKLLI